MYERYLPTLMLKKQQLQGEIRVTELRIKELMDQKEILNDALRTWVAVFGERGFFTADLVAISSLKTSAGNIAGVIIPIFQGADFTVKPYDLARMPLWIDRAVEKMQQVILLDLEAKVLEEQRKRLDNELRITTQRVNLFEKIKIPETRANIKKINVYLGDQQTAAVVRGKIAKRGMERAAT
jgi:V/A-type H+-transporting ATPase subunit D